MHHNVIISYVISAYCPDYYGKIITAINAAT